MQCTLLILTAIVISTATTDSNKFIPNRDHRQIALCIQKIVHKYFTKGRTILVSMPREEHPTGRSLSPPPYDNNRALVSFTLTKLHENVSWPLRLFPPEISLDAVAETTHSYMIFLWTKHEDTDVMETLTNQLDTLNEAEGASWNPRGRFLAVRDIYVHINCYKHESVNDVPKYSLFFLRSIRIIYMHCAGRTHKI